MNDLVSIVIPVFNGAKYLSYAIESALSQTYTNIEIIVINDGSNDLGKTKNVAMKYENKIRYFEKENGGVSSALNFGIEVMRGKYFSWLSHDDIYYENKITDQMEIYNKSEFKDFIIFSHENQINDNNKIIHEGKLFNYDMRYLERILLTNRFIGGCSLLIPNCVFDKIGLFDESLRAAQDYDMWFRCLNGGIKFNYCPILSGASRIHREQVSKKNAKLCKSEKSYLIGVIARMDEESIKGADSSLELAYLKIAFKFKKEGLDELVKYLLLKAKVDSNNKTLENIKIKVLKYRIFLWNKYFDPRNYLKFLKRTLVR